jgi:hypothetical protein
MSAGKSWQGSSNASGSATVAAPVSIAHCIAHCACVALKFVAQTLLVHNYGST